LLEPWFFSKAPKNSTFFLAPFVAYIDVPENRTELAKMVGYMGQLILFPTVFFANSMGHVLVYIFYSQFKKLKKDFRRAVGEGGRFSGDLSWFRRRHKLLTNKVIISNVINCNVSSTSPDAKSGS